VRSLTVLSEGEAAAQGGEGRLGDSLHGEFLALVGAVEKIKIDKLLKQIPRAKGALGMTRHRLT
jgi:hypothetical protein